VTCDNASNNDTMIDELKELLEIFPGAENQTRCFTHILNLDAKSILRQFDAPKGKGRKADETLDAAVRALEDLTADLEEEEEEMERDTIADGDEEDNEEGLIDIRESMSAEEIAKLDATIQPVRVFLVKVSSISDSKPQTLSDHNQHSFGNSPMLLKIRPRLSSRSGFQYSNDLRKLMRKLERTLSLHG
jgi:hypothetical protein